MQPGQNAFLIFLGTQADHVWLIFDLLSAPELVRLRATCSKARKIVDELPTWAEVLPEMNVWMSRFFDSPRDDVMTMKSMLPDLVSLTDIRIQASLICRSAGRPFLECARLYTFARTVVSNIQRQISFPPPGGASLLSVERTLLSTYDFMLCLNLHELRR